MSRSHVSRGQVSRPSVRRRSAAFALSVGICALAATGLAATGPAVAASPVSAPYTDPTPGPSGSPPDDEAPARILVTTLEPRAPLDPAGFFQVRGTVVNRGSQPLHDLALRLREGDRLRTRGELATADAEPPATGRRLGDAPVPAARPDLPAGASTSFDIRMRISDLHLGSIGVYPLKVEARARFGNAGSADVVGSVQTYVPWFPDGPPRGKIRLAWLWPLVDQPRRAPGELMLDDELATSFARGGRLDRLLRSAADGQKGGCDPAPAPPAGSRRPARTAPCLGDTVPVTYAVDPDLLFNADALTLPYQVAAGGGKTRRIEDTAPARQWLATLRSAVADADVLALPYADPDVVALTEPETGLADEVSLLVALGRRVTTQLLDKEPLSSVVWPPAGRLTRPAVEALTASGAGAVTVDPSALPAPDHDSGRTPDTDVGPLPTNTGQPSLLTIDSGLSALLTPPPSDEGDRLAEQRWIAETAIIAAESPSLAPRTLLVAPSRRADVRPAIAAGALGDTGRLPWLCGVTVASVAAGGDTCPGELRADQHTLPPVELDTPHPGDPLLSPTFLRGVREVRRESTQFTDEVLAKPTSTEAVGTTGRLLRARARTESSAWREHAPDGERMLSLLHSDLDTLRHKVHLQVGRGTLTLTSSSGVISVNVVNELRQQVQVGVVLDAGNRARLSTRDTPVTTVPAEHATQINLKVTAQTSGKFPVTAQLVDRDGHPFGSPVRLVVRSTQYGRVALAVTGVGAGVLLAAAGIRIVRRALSRAHA